MTKTIKAQFDSRCIGCGNPIMAGAKAEWTKGEGVRHPECEGDAYAPLATGKQRSFLETLVERVQFPADEAEARVRELLDDPALTKSKASTLIGAMKELPARPRSEQPKPDVPDVPAGRYAIDGDDGEVQLLIVWIGSRTGVVHVYAAAADDHTAKGDRLDRASEKAVLDMIAENPAAAAIRYGHHTGSCSRCGKELEVALSRHLGIGPVCGKHWHDPDTWTQIKADAREYLRSRGVDPQAGLEVRV